MQNIAHTWETNAYLTDEENALAREFMTKGYVIKPVVCFEALSDIRDTFCRLAADYLGMDTPKDSMNFLNQIHKLVSVEKLNEFRLAMIRGINSCDRFRIWYFQVVRSYLHTIVGNELAMQMRVNLSIQMPHDTSSLLAVHSDTWNGDSPYEVVVWLPVVDCYGTKAMYILPPGPSHELVSNFSIRAGTSGEELYQSIRNQVEWLEVKYGEVLVFDQALPHGNRVNTENETRWSMNCRFKQVFTPYGDKKLGEFFEPVSVRPASKLGLKYQLPEAK
jgi:sporadic carbohydrate cluster 2OG-Fe(II) oxygenase